MLSVSLTFSVVDVGRELRGVLAVVVWAGAVGGPPRRLAAMATSAAEIAVLADARWVPVTRLTATVRPRVDGPAGAATLRDDGGVDLVVLRRVGVDHQVRVTYGTNRLEQKLVRAQLMTGQTELVGIAAALEHWLPS